MTDVVVANTQPAEWAAFAGAGQEDVTAADMRLPRLKLDKTGVFINSITKESLGATINTVILGCVKQRTFFPPASGGDLTGQPPICKSNDFVNGFPSEPFNDKSDNAFPWSEAGLLRSDHPLNTELGRVVISCDTCQLKEWRTKTFKDSGRPYCAQMHTYALLYQTPNNDWVPAVMTVKGMSIKASSSYLGAFAMAGGRPFFTAYTQLRLTPQINGQVEYATISFLPDMNSTTPQENWAGYYTQTNEVRDMLRQAPRPFEKDENTGEMVAPEIKAAQVAAQSPENQWNQQVANQGPPPAWASYVQPEENGAPVTGAVIDGPPSAPVPQQQPAPVQQQPVAAPRAPATPPPPAPMAPPAPPQVAAPRPPVAAQPPAPPVQPPAPPAPQVQPAPQAQAQQPQDQPYPVAPGSQDDDELPF